MTKTMEVKKSSHPVLRLSPYSLTFYYEWARNPASTNYHTIIGDSLLKGSLDVARLQEAAGRFVKENYLFNSFVCLDDKGLYWEPNRGDSPLHFYHAETNVELLEIVKAPFDLETGPLYKVVLHQISKQEFRCTLVAHHILIDGSSVDFVNKSISEYCQHQ